MELKPSQMDQFLKSSKPVKASTDSGVIKLIFYGEDISLSGPTTGYTVKKSDIMSWAKKVEASGEINDLYAQSAWSNGGGPFDAELFCEQLFSDGDMIEAVETGALRDALDSDVIPCQKVEVEAEFSGGDDDDDPWGDEDDDWGDDDGGLGHEGVELISPKGYLAYFAE